MQYMPRKADFAMLQDSEKILRCFLIPIVLVPCAAAFFFLLLLRG